MRFFPSLVSGLLLAFPASAETLCPGSWPGLALRRGSPSCWVSYSVGPARELCIPHRLWRSMIGRPDGLAPLFRGCGEWRGKWRMSSPPENGGAPKRLLSRFVVEAPPPVRGGSAFGFPSARALAASTERLRERISELLARGDPWGISRRLVLDERVPGAPIGLLRLLGFVHLFTAAGIHLYALAAAIAALVRSACGALGWSAHAGIRLAAALAGVSWTGAWLLAGLRPGLLRPVILVLLRSGARRIGWRWHPAAPLGLALGVDGAVGLLRWSGGGEAWAPGRWHYALAVGGGLLALELRRSRSLGRGGLKDWMLDHLALSAGSWWLTAVWDAATTSLLASVTPMISLLSLPLMTAVLYPSLGIAVVGQVLGAHVWSAAWASATARAIHGVNSALAEVALGVGSLWVVPAWCLLAGAALALVHLLVPKALRAVLVASLLIRLALLVPYLAPASPGPARRVEQLDIGQGDAALVEASDSSFGMLDAGSERALPADAWIRLLSERGVFSLHWVALTHLDEDHVGGLVTLVSLLPVAQVASSRQEWESERGGKLKSFLAGAGVPAVPWEGSRFPYDVLGPDPGTQARSDGNSRMSSFRVPLANGRVYFSAGDSDRDGELRAARWARALSPAGTRFVLKVSHHGSRYATDPATLRLLRPEESWISAGTGNLHGHPTVEALDRLRRSGTKIRRTDREGAIGYTKRPPRPFWLFPHSRGKSGG